MQPVYVYQRNAQGIEAEILFVPLEDKKIGAESPVSGAPEGPRETLSALREKCGMA
jgi:hypothetical protein